MKLEENEKSQMKFKKKGLSYMKIIYLVPFFTEKKTVPQQTVDACFPLVILLPCHGNFLFL